MDEDLDYLQELNQMNETSALGLMEDLYESAVNYANLVDELEQKVNVYIADVDRFQRGEISRHKLKESMFEYAKVNEEVFDAYNDLIEHRSEAEVFYDSIESDISQMSFMMSQGAIAEEEKKIEEDYSFEDKESVLPFIRPGDQVMNEIMDKELKISNAADMYKSDFLDRTFMTLDEATEEFRDPEHQAELNKIKDAQRAEEVMKNPNDRYIDFTGSDGTEDMEAVREDIRSSPPSGKRPNSVDKDTIERNSKEIRDAKEKINNKDSLRYIH